jgi:predicted acyltransferase
VTTPRERLASLDVFRGITVAAMILVNNPGDWTNVYAPLLHAAWTGWTFADVIFPSFIFAMGLAMPFAFARRVEGGERTRDVHRRIAARVAWLIGLGLVLNGVTAWTTAAPLRVPGVLQRIAAAYLIASLVLVHVRPSRWAGAAAVLMAAHWAILAMVPFDSAAAGTLTPEHNVAGWLDAHVFGRHALGPPNDPEGILGTLTAAATALTGALAGEFLRRPRNAWRRAAGLTLAGAASLAAGAAWSFLLPISKPLWTGSFVLATSGLILLAFVPVYLLVDVARLSAWARPFLWLGVNPLALYFGSEVAGHLLEAPWIPERSGATTVKAWLFWRYLAPSFHSAERASLAFGIAFAALWVAAAGTLYRRRIYLRV